MSSAREKIIQAAMELFWLKGYNSTSIADLLSPAANELVDRGHQEPSCGRYVASAARFCAAVTRCVVERGLKKPIFIRYGDARQAVTAPDNHAPSALVMPSCPGVVGMMVKGA